MKKLSELLQGIPVHQIVGNTEQNIEKLSQDTRDDFIKGGTVYVAIKGTQVDGHQFIEQAIDQGANVIVCGTLPEVLRPQITYVHISQPEYYLGELAHNFYHHRSEKIKIIAITGTNGKTTIAQLLYQAVQALGKKAAIFSTAGDYVNGEIYHSGKKAESSMEVIELHRNIQKIVDEYNAEYLFLEATSHALDQHRLNGVCIDGAVFTNLSQDHLNYHHTFEHYADAKQRLFTLLDKDSFALVNAESPYAEHMLGDTQARKKKYGQENAQWQYDYTFKVLEQELAGTKISLSGREVETQLVGNFNMYNLTAMFGVLVELGFSREEICSVIPKLKGAEGRMEIIQHPNKNIVGIVDYAHSPDALENVLQTLKAIPHNHIITVVGCGGDRDRTKRAPMARIAQEFSDMVFYTSDNPRTEDPEQIFDDMKQGVDEQKKNYTFLLDREEAMKQAVLHAQADDIILVAGKGHEDYQIIGTEKKHFDDREILRKYLLI